MNRKHPKNYMETIPVLPVDADVDAWHQVLPQAASFSQVGMSCGHLMCGKAKPLSFGVQMFMKSMVFQQRFNTHSDGNQGLREVLSLRHDQRCFAAILHSQTSQSEPCAGGFIMLLCSFQRPRQISAFLTLSPTKT